MARSQKSKAAIPTTREMGPNTIDEYIAAAPLAGHTQLRRLYRLLKSVAPGARGTIKWGTPFFVEPRFVFAFSAHKSHCTFAPSASTMAAFREELNQHHATKGLVQIPYDAPFPEDLIRRMAEHSLRVVTSRTDDGFW